jgi:transposase
MEYFKASEIVNTYKVGKRTVYHWIETAKEKKISLDLVTIGNKTFISNTHHNLILLKTLTNKGKKFKNRK